MIYNLYLKFSPHFHNCAFGNGRIDLFADLLNDLLNILNKSENATPELSAIYIQNYANQECK